MEDRFSYDKEGPARCGICGGLVHEQLVEGRMSAADTEPPFDVQRICQNPECLSNKRDGSITDAV
jgi:hypothetical protein